MAEIGVLVPATMGEATRLLLFRGMLRGSISGWSVTGETIVARPVAPFHSGFSTGVFRGFNLRTRS